MSAIEDFEDLLGLFERHGVRYLVVGGLAFIYHAKPRYTKDMDLWVDAGRANVGRANQALTEFGSPFLLDASKPEQIVQIGIAPNRVDLLLQVGGVDFARAWRRRVRGRYGRIEANWMDLDSLLAVKERIDSPKHQLDAEVLREVKKLREGRPRRRRPSRG